MYNILTLKMTTAQAVEISVTNNSLSKDYPHPDNLAKQITDTVPLDSSHLPSIIYVIYQLGGLSREKLYPRS